MRCKIVFFTTFFSLCFPFSSFAAEGYFGGNPGLDFYSMIDDDTVKMTNGLIQQRLKGYTTFAGFGKTCRKSDPWIDNAPMDEGLLQDAANGIYTRIIVLAKSANKSLSSVELTELAECLGETYRSVARNASDQQNALERIGSLGLYTDGDTANSDYDIITDIENINKIIFSEEEKYKGTKNIAQISFDDLLSGEPIRSLFGSDDETATGEENGSGTGTNENPGSEGTEGPPTPGSIGIGSICRAEGGITTVGNMVDSDFLEDLSDTIQKGNGASENIGADYGNFSDPDSYTGVNSDQSTPTSEGDFFHDIPCDSIFCIKVRMISGNQNLFGGGKNSSIEGIAEKHLDILDPISDTNLASHVFTKGFFQSTLANVFKISQLIPKPLIYTETSKPQVVRRDKKETTPKSKDELFNNDAKCAMYSVGLPNDLNLANGLAGGSYGITSATTVENLPNTVKELNPSDPETYAGAADCFDVALSQGRKAYYNSFSTDLTEIATFTSGMIAEIKEIIASGYRIDTLPVRK